MVFAIQAALWTSDGLQLAVLENIQKSRNLCPPSMVSRDRTRARRLSQPALAQSPTDACAPGRACCCTCVSALPHVRGGHWRAIMRPRRGSVCHGPARRGGCSKTPTSAVVRPRATPPLPWRAPRPRQHGPPVAPVGPRPPPPPPQPQPPPLRPSLPSHLPCRCRDDHRPHSRRRPAEKGVGVARRCRPHHGPRLRRRLCRGPPPPRPA